MIMMGLTYIYLKYIKILLFRTAFSKVMSSNCGVVILIKVNYVT